MAAAAAKTGGEDEHTTHPSVDTSGRFAVDQLLRRIGKFHIWRRPSKGEAIWLKDGKEISQSKALKTISKSLVQDAQYAQTLYLEAKYR